MHLKAVVNWKKYWLLGVIKLVQNQRLKTWILQRKYKNTQHFYKYYKLLKLIEENLKNNFNAKPSGYINKWDKDLLGYNKQARYWTSDDRSSFEAPNDAFWVGLNSNYVYIGAYDHVRQTYKSKYEGMTVRLIKDTTL